MGKNCALGLEHGPRPKAEGRTQDLGHSFFPIRTSRPVSNIYFFHEKSEYPVAIREGLVIHLNAASITARKMFWM